MKSDQNVTVRFLISGYLFTLIVYLILVFVFSSRHGGFHGFVRMEKNAILTLRTTLAGVGIFVFSLLIWLLYRRSEARDYKAWNLYTLLALTIAEIPAFFGLVLFFLRGAFKTFFAFFALSVVYSLIAWPRSNYNGRG